MRCVGGARRNGSAMALPPASGWACCTYGTRSTLQGSSFASTPPRSTTRSTAFDDHMLVNAHVYGAPAAHSPVLHLRRLPGGQLFDHYQAAFERVWEQASTDNVPAVLAQGERR
jgi:hypothetical protein